MSCWWRLLAAIVSAGAGAWIYQIETGIGQTNLHPPIFWSAYIASFVYWIGVSHSGTFISGVLRLTKAEWRRPITSVAELMTIISVVIATLFVFYHLGRSWRWYYLIPYPNQREIWPDFRSPLMWDATAVFTYATASTIYLYLPLIPDFALAPRSYRRLAPALVCRAQPGLAGSQPEWQRAQHRHPHHYPADRDDHDLGALHCRIGLRHVAGAGLAHVDHRALFRGRRRPFRAGHGGHRFVRGAPNLSS